MLLGYSCVLEQKNRKFTSAKMKGVSYFRPTSPSLMAYSEAGPQQKTPDNIEEPGKKII